MFVEVHPETPLLELDRDRRDGRAFADHLRRRHPDHLARDEVRSFASVSEAPNFVATRVRLANVAEANDREKRSREALERRKALTRGEDIAGRVVKHLVTLADIDVGAILGGITSVSPELRALSGSPSIDAARMRLTNLLELVEWLPADYASPGGRLRRLAGRGRASAAATHVAKEMVDAMTAVAVEAHIRATRCAVERGFFRATYGGDPADARSPLEGPGVARDGGSDDERDRTGDRGDGDSDSEGFVGGASDEDVYLFVVDGEFRARALGPAPSAARRFESRDHRVVSNARPRGTVCGNVPAPRLEVFADDASRIDGARRCADDWRGRPPHVVRGGYPYAALTGRDGACAEDLFARAAAEDAAREIARRLSVGGGEDEGEDEDEGEGGAFGGSSRTYRPRRARGRRGRVIRASDASE